jgi:hypothetical protein
VTGDPVVLVVDELGITACELSDLVAAVAAEGSTMDEAVTSAGFDTRDHREAGAMVAAARRANSGGDWWAP